MHPIALAGRVEPPVRFGAAVDLGHRAGRRVPQRDYVLLGVGHDEGEARVMTLHMVGADVFGDRQGLERVDGRLR